MGWGKFIGTAGLFGAYEEREKLHVRLDKIEQVFYINSGDFIPKSSGF